MFFIPIKVMHQKQNANQHCNVLDTSFPIKVMHQKQNGKQHCNEPHTLFLIKVIRQKQKRVEKQDCNELDTSFPSKSISPRSYASARNKMKNKTAMKHILYFQLRQLWFSDADKHIHDKIMQKSAICLWKIIKHIINVMLWQKEKQLRVVDNESMLTSCLASLLLHEGAYKQTTRTTAMRTSTNNRFYEQNNLCTFPLRQNNNVK